MKTELQSREILRNIPSVDKILNWPELKEYLNELEHLHLTTIIRYKIAEFRNRLIAGEKLNLEYLKASIVQELKELINPYYWIEVPVVYLW